MDSPNGSNMTEEVAQLEVTWLDYLKDQTVPFDERLDRWEEYMSQFEQVEAPVEHSFPDVMYVRKITMPAGSIITSKIHKLDNPFFITRGKLSVVSENDGAVEYCAPFMGITKPGTRRILFIHEETDWTTVHLNIDNSRDMSLIEDRLTYTKPSTLSLIENNKKETLLCHGSQLE